MLMFMRERSKERTCGCGFFLNTRVSEAVRDGAVLHMADPSWPARAGVESLHPLPTPCPRPSLHGSTCTLGNATGCAGSQDAALQVSVQFRCCLDYNA